jgi:hypothetical protein
MTAVKKKMLRYVLEFFAAILSAAITALGTTSCMGFGPIRL